MDEDKAISGVVAAIGVDTAAAVCPPTCSSANRTLEVRGVVLGVSKSGTERNEDSKFKLIDLCIVLIRVVPDNSFINRHFDLLRNKFENERTCILLGDREVTANIYCTSRKKIREIKELICGNFWVTQ